MINNTHFIKAILEGNSENNKPIFFGYCENYEKLKEFIIKNVIISENISKVKIDFSKRISVS